MNIGMSRLQNSRILYHYDISNISWEQRERYMRSPMLEREEEKCHRARKRKWKRTIVYTSHTDSLVTSSSSALAFFFPFRPIPHPFPYIKRDQLTRWRNIRTHRQRLKPSRGTPLHHRSPQSHALSACAYGIGCVFDVCALNNAAGTGEESAAYGEVGIGT